jgi:hypothetical protein
MKQCPNCRTTYTDDALRFCLADGTALVSAPNEAETVQIPFNKNPARVDVPPDSAPTVFTPLVSLAQPKNKGAGLIIGGVLGVFLLFLLVGGVAAFLLLRSSDDKKAIVAASPSPLVSPTASSFASPTAAPNDETAALKEKLANLEKQVGDQNNRKLPAATPPETFSPPKQSTTTARANSPRDGFLALRSEPNSETGFRIAKIPHGATLTVLGCPKSSNVGKMTGRWCQVIYNGQSGWAFDGFMVF